MADFGEILITIGDFGLFQKLVVLGLSLPNFILPLHLASLLFIESDPSRHCNTDWILRASPNLTTEEQLNLTVPREQDGSLSRCLMFSPVDWDIDTIREYGLNDTTECQSGWVYDRTMYEATIVTDFDLVCGKESSTGIAQTVFMAGIVVGSLLFGPFAESFGRKRASQIPMVLMLIFTITTGLSPNFYVYLASMFVVGISYGGYRVNCIVLATEWVGVTKRSFASCLCQLLSGFGSCTLPGLIYSIRDWRTAQFVIAAPAGLALLYIWLIPESARWLLDRGRTEEAKQLIFKAAAINKREVPDTLFEKIVEKKTTEKGGIRALISSPVLRRNILVISFAWFSLNLAYFSLSFNVGNFGLDIFVTQLMFGSTGILAHILCIWLSEAVGRKICLIFTLLIGGLVCILILVVPQDNAIAITVLATAGRFFMNWASSVCNVYIQELFPTSVRQTATGLGNTVNRVAGMLAPLLNLLAMYHWTIPTIVFSSLALGSGGLVFLLPETRRKELPDSTDEAEGQRNMTKIAKDHMVHHYHYDKSTKL